MDYFLLLPQSDAAHQTLPPKSYTERLAHKVERRIRELAGQADPAMPYIPWVPKVKKLAVRRQWPDNSGFPPLHQGVSRPRISLRPL